MKLKSTMELAATFKILFTFAGVLLLNRLRLSLGLALLLGGLVLDLWSGRGPATVGVDLGQALLRPELWLLVVNIILIIEVGSFMAADANARVIINSARRFGGKHGKFLSLILIPAAIGLVPMPGGALFSAPLIDQTVNKNNTTPEWKAAVNYWFRHILEYWWPLYPVVIITLSIFTVSTWQFMALQIPFTLFSIGAGYFFLLRSHPDALPSGPVATREAGERLLPVLLPILIIVLTTLVLPEPLRAVLPDGGSTVRKMLAMLAGLLIALGLIRRSSRQQNGPGLFTNLLTRKTGNVALTLIGVMVFQSLLGGSQLLPLAGRELAASQVPVSIIVAFLPFLAGLVTGIAMGFAGAAFPLVVGLLEVGAAGLTPLSTLVLAFSMGYAGMMLSPVHLCFVLTKDFFAAPFIRVYRHILPCVASIMAAGIIMSVLLGRLGW
ncbi:MAG: DUF401 family protein [Desulfobacterales bacterium]|nr:DUF401 family protein [Desulfobacterales bacterium]